VTEHFQPDLETFKELAFATIGTAVRKYAVLGSRWINSTKLRRYPACLAGKSVAPTIRPTKAQAVQTLKVLKHQNRS
jgi:hypothetical protein